MLLIRKSNFGQKSQYIDIKFPLHKESERVQRDMLVLTTLRYIKAYGLRIWNSNEEQWKKIGGNAKKTTKSEDFLLY